MTIAKAEAMEKLCGDNAFIYIDRLLAMQVQQAAYDLGLVNMVKAAEALERDYFWFPDVSDAFDGMKKSLRKELDEKIMAAPHNRYERRRAKSKARKLDINEGMDKTISEFAKIYRLPVEHIDNSIGAVLRDEIPPAVGAHRLFSAVAQPTKFVHAYFVQMDGDKDLPEFVSDLGRNCSRAFRRYAKICPSCPLHLRPISNGFNESWLPWDAKRHAIYSG
jgi:hypothetical protein